MRRRSLVAMAASLVASFLFVLAAAPAQDGSGRDAEVAFLDIGQGDAILIRAPEGKAALIDAGPSSRVVEVIRRQGVSRLDLVAVSHHHTDHFGGMDDVVREMHPRFYLATRATQPGSTYRRLLEDVKASGARMIEPSSDKPRRIELGSVHLTVLPQPPRNEKEENDNSIGIRVDIGRVSVLLTGDSEEDERAWWMRHCPELLANCMVLKLAHHGSHNGTDADWLKLVKPKAAVASLGEGNSFGHPHQETLDLLADAGIPLLRTDERGTIVLRTDGRRASLEGERPAGMAAKSKPGRDRTTRRVSRVETTTR